MAAFFVHWDTFAWTGIHYGKEMAEFNLHAIGSLLHEEVLEVGKEIMKTYINLVEEFYFITKAISSICL